MQILYGEVDLDDDLREPERVADDLRRRRRPPRLAALHLDLDFDQAGNFGFTVRIVPRHDDLESYIQLGHVAWAPSPGAR